MKTSRSVSLVAILFLASAASLAQQEAGDNDLGFFGTYSTFGSPDDRYHEGMLAVTYGRFVTDNIEIAIAPTFSFLIKKYTSTYNPSTGRYDNPIKRTFTSSNSTFGASAYFTYSFLAQDAKTVPYVGAAYFNPDFKTTHEAAGLNVGLKFFLSRKTALDLKGNYLFSLEKDQTGGELIITFGLSFLF